MLSETYIKKLPPDGKEQLLEYLTGYLTPRRKSRFKDVLKYRTRHITIVAEDTFREHNASALIRTCDCFGIQDMHIIEEYHTFRIARGMAKGAQKWVDVHFYNEYEDNVQKCIDELRDKKYRIVAACPHANGKDPEDFDISLPFAIFFGKEKAGLSKKVMEQADEFITIPMVGFTESFNISVSAAIILHSLTSRLHKTNDPDWHLTSEEQRDVLLDWSIKTIQNGPRIARDFLNH